MDFTNRVTPQTHAQPVDSSADTAAGNHHSKTKIKKSASGPAWLAAIGIVCLAVLLLATLLVLVFGGTDQNKYINKNEYQAVDINIGGSSSGDQIYFGNLRTINSTYLVLENVFYIPTTTSTSSNITLEPLVCQIDEPVNQMLINHSSVNWWENLQNSSKVSKTISSYEKSNPSTPACTSTNSTTPSTSSTPSSTTK
ncbi:MAG TPA: hypothetical protein VMQ52_01420 [Candidatus Saccharimonadales bacterium]|jgi:hypothetical protein|nr:hypothetical protein [Candidatus Saccharimonadales bacterium]